MTAAFLLAAAPAQGVLPLEDWEWPPWRQSSPSAAPVLAVDGFEAPLDWLLDLARTRRIDLARISILALVNAFEEALTAALAAPGKTPLTLARWGDWLLMAAELTLLRSRLLVPADPVEAQCALVAAERLRHVLLDRAAMTAAVAWLEGQAQLGHDVFERGAADPDAAPRAARRGDITGLLRGCLVAILVQEGEAARFWVAGPPFWTVGNAARRIREVLAVAGAAERPLTAFLPEVPADAADRELRCRVAVSATFLAGLELTREGHIAIGQAGAWAPIQVRQAPMPTIGEPAAG